MDDHGFAFFETPVGRCAVVWGAAGLVGLQLPESTDAESRARLRRRFPHAVERAPSPAAQAAIDVVTAQLSGASTAVPDFAIDYRGVGAFERRVYEAARRIPPGETVTYGALAREIGEPDAARAVGQALGRNPFPLVVPCHRVVAAGWQERRLLRAGRHIGQDAAAGSRRRAGDGAAVAVLSPQRPD